MAHHVIVGEYVAVGTYYHSRPRARPLERSRLCPALRCIRTEEKLQASTKLKWRVLKSDAGSGVDIDYAYARIGGDVGDSVLTQLKAMTAGSRRRTRRGGDARLCNG